MACAHGRIWGVYLSAERGDLGAPRGADLHECKLPARPGDQSLSASTAQSGEAWVPVSGRRVIHIGKWGRPPLTSEEGGSRRAKA